MRAVFQLALALLLPATCTFAQPHAPQPETSRKRPAVVSADALAFGAKIEARASSELLDWVDDYMDAELRWHDPNLKLLNRRVEAAFSAYPPATRNSVAFLVLYLAYHDQRKLEESSAQALRSNAEEAARLQQELDQGRRRKFGSAVMSTDRSPFTPSDRESELTLRIRELENRSNMRMNQVREIRRRVDFYLRALHAARIQLVLAPPEALASVRPADSPR